MQYDVFQGAWCPDGNLTRGVMMFMRYGVVFFWLVVLMLSCTMLNVRNKKHFKKQFYNIIIFVLRVNLIELMLNP